MNRSMPFYPKTSMTPLLTMSRILAVSLLVFLLAGCEEDDFLPTGPNFDTVPAPLDLDEAQESYTLNNGMEIHIHEQGDPEGLQVVERSRVQAHYTIRNGEGDIAESSWRDGRTLPESLTIQNFSDRIEGFTMGLVELSDPEVPAMREGGVRTIIIPENKGYSSDHRFGDDRLYIDFELHEVVD